LKEFVRRENSNESNQSAPTRTKMKGTGASAIDEIMKWQKNVKAQFPLVRFVVHCCGFLMDLL